MGGLFGAGIWAGISYLTNREIGWIAVGVGFVTGLGVRVLAGEEDGLGYGVLAVVIAMLALLAGKDLSLSLLVSDVDAKLVAIEISIDEEDMIESKAAEVAKEWTAAKKHAMVDNKPTLLGGEYLPAVKAEGKRRWKVTKPADK